MVLLGIAVVVVELLGTVAPPREAPTVSADTLTEAVLAARDQRVSGVLKLVAGSARSGRRL